MARGSARAAIPGGRAAADRVAADRAARSVRGGDVMSWPQRIAVGCCKPDDLARERPQIVIRFDRETFDQVAATAARNGISFNEQVLTFVEWGLEAKR